MTPSDGTAFDEQRYERRVAELVRDGMDRELACEEAWLEQHPAGDVIVEDRTAIDEHIERRKADNDFRDRLRKRHQDDAALYKRLAG